MKRILSMVGLVPLALLLSSCNQTKTTGPGSISLGTKTSALSVMEKVAIGANSCWFKSKDSDFRNYRLSPELNSFTGRPRILIVPKNNPAERPLLVVQASGNPAEIEAFGPLMTMSVGNRIARDISNWSKGQNNC